MPGSKKYFIFIALFFYSGSTFGQEKKALPISISLFNESTAIPYTQFITTPIHPGLQIGTEFNYSAKRQSRLFQTLNASYFYHNYLSQGIGLTSELGYELRSKFGLTYTGLLGIGYMHTLSNAEEFTFSNGKYEMKPDKGNPRFVPSLSIDVGYYLSPKINSPQIFLRYQSWVEFPYSPGFIPIMTHINLHVGFKFFIHSNHQENE